MSLRELARRLYRSHSNLVEYERGHRLPPLDVVRAYEQELGVEAGTLVALHEQAHRDVQDEYRSRRAPYAAAYALRPATGPGIRQLPADVAGFTGREEELTRLHAAVAGSTDQGAPMGVWVIAGMAGVGKTALAVHLAHQLAPQFPDAHLHMDLHGYEPRQRLSTPQALDRLLRALGLPPEVLPRDVEEQSARYRALLSGKRALIILDNVSSAGQVRPLLPGGARCLVLVTSRDRLLGLVAGEGAHLLSLEILSPSESVALLTTVVGQDRVSLEPEAAATVARQCGYLPLAIRIAAARMAARPTVTIAETARRLAGAHHRLDELQAGDQRVRGSFALSYGDLSPVAARLFRRLGLVAGPHFSSGVAAALIDGSLDEAEGLLEELSNAHLLEATRTHGRYRFHDLLRLYARERVEAEEDEQQRGGALGRMLAWYVDIARAADRLLSPGRRPLPRNEPGERASQPAFATHAHALAWCETERANLVAATRQAADAGLDAVAWLLPNALFGFFDHRSYWADWQETHAVGLAAARAAHDRQAEAWTLIHLGSAHGDLRRFEEATNCHRQALRISREIGDRRCEGVALGNLGLIHSLVERLEDAIDFCQHALLIDREVGYRRAEGLNLLRLGEVYRKLQDFPRSIDYIHQALAIFRDLGDCFHESMAINNIGNVYREAGQIDEAIDSLKLAVSLYRTIGAPWGEGEALHYLGLALQHSQRMDEARVCWREALRIFIELRAPDADDVRALLGG